MYMEMMDFCEINDAPESIDLKLQVLRIGMHHSRCPGLGTSKCCRGCVQTMQPLWRCKQVMRGECTCCSKGAMPGTKSSAENSMVPSTLKCVCASGSRNSRKVVVKKVLYSSWPTWAAQGSGFRHHSVLHGTGSAHPGSALDALRQDGRDAPERETPTAFWSSFADPAPDE